MSVFYDSWEEENEIDELLMYHQPCYINILSYERFLYNIDVFLQTLDEDESHVYWKVDMYYLLHPTQNPYLKILYTNAIQQIFQYREYILSIQKNIYLEEFFSMLYNNIYSKLYIYTDDDLYIKLFKNNLFIYHLLCFKKYEEEINEINKYINDTNHDLFLYFEKDHYIEIDLENID